MLKLKKKYKYNLISNSKVKYLMGINKCNLKCSMDKIY